MASLTVEEGELVAIGAAIGAGCQPCTQYHVTAALKNGLPQADVSRAVEQAQLVRRKGDVAVVNVARRLLGFEGQQAPREDEPLDRPQALISIGAAAGCNAGSLLTPYLTTTRQLGLTAEELRSALEIADVVKQHAAEFLRRDAEKALKETPSPASDPGASPQDCCGSASQPCEA